MTARIRCMVVHCNRTRRPGCDEWICAEHWKLIRRDRRRAFRRAVARGEVQVADMMWRRLVKEANDKAHGNG
jgi:hypothetical protein